MGARFENVGRSYAGAAYVFRRDQGGPGDWGEVKKLTAPDAETDDAFGIWRDRKIDGVAYQRKLRRDWSR